MNSFLNQMLRFPMSMAQVTMDQAQKMVGPVAEAATPSGQLGSMDFGPMPSESMPLPDFGTRPQGPGHLEDAIYNLAKEVGTSTERIVNSLGGSKGNLPVFDDAALGPDEEVLICYTVGTLKFTRLNELSRAGGVERSSVAYGLLDMDLYDVTGKHNGRYLTVWKPEVQPGERPASLRRYTGPWLESDMASIREIPKFEFRANSVAEYSFLDQGGSLYATGPANLLIIPLSQGSKQFQISVATYVTGGTGPFANATGVNTALGSSYLPEDVPEFNFLDPPYGLPTIPGVTVSTFRIVRHNRIDTSHPLHSELSVEQMTG